MSEAKPFGYELMDVKLGSVITRLNSTIRRIKKYLDGSIPCLEKLEETRLPYFEKNADKRENHWSQITRACLKIKNCTKHLFLSPFYSIIKKKGCSLC